MNPIRIGYIWQYQTADSHLSTITAVSLHIRAIIKELEKKGYHVRIVTFYQNRPHWSDNLVDWHPVETKVLNKPFHLIESILRGIQSRLHLPYFNLFESYKFAISCRSTLSDCDVLYERFWILASGGAMISRMLKIPIIYEVNGDIVEEYDQQGLQLSNSQWAAINSVTSLLLRTAGHVIPVSQTLKEKLVSRYRLHSHNIRVIENGAKVDLFANTNHDKITSARKLYGLDDFYTIIFVGTFKPWHGIDLLVDAFGEIAKSHNNVKLLLVGDGPLKMDIERQVSMLQINDRTIFTGLLQHNEVPTLLEIADIAVLNPRVSGASSAQSPLKLFEYMAAGKAIIAPRISNIERILRDRESALFVDPDNMEALKGAIIELLENEHLRRVLGHTAKKQAKNHSWGHTVSEIEEIMKDLIKSRASI